MTTGSERLRYVVYGGPWERDAVLDYVARYEGPEDAEFPGCVPIPMTAEQFEEYDGGLEYWSRELGWPGCCATAARTTRTRAATCRRC